jgi:hypothetical protein
LDGSDIAYVEMTRNALNLERKVLNEADLLKRSIG